MKIVHISDVHIRNLKRHDEYLRVFENLYREIRNLKPDIVLNTGDTAHTKTQISPEFVEMTSNHIKRVSELVPYHIILGNHDLNLTNLDRIDAISPIIKSIDSKNVFLHKKSGRFDLDKDNILWVYSCADKENYPNKNDLDNFKDKVHIGAYHGTVACSTTDIGWVLEADSNIEIFDGLDYVLLGDIHKHQFIDREKRMAYPGSLIQQNFGEDPDKGFLFWDIRNKDDHDVDFIKLNGSRKYYTVRIDKSSDIDSYNKNNIDDNSRIRIIVKKSSLLLNEKNDIVNKSKDAFNTDDIIIITDSNVTNQKVKNSLLEDTTIEKLRDLNVQEKLISEFLNDYELSEEVIKNIYDINAKYQNKLEKNEDVARNVSWKIDEIKWRNMFKYGEDNIVNFEKLQKGIIGIFAPNWTGKSTFIDILTESLFDKTTHELSKNLFLINDNKESAEINVKFSVGDQNYSIDRIIERVKYGQRKKDIKEWGKTAIDFKKLVDGDSISLNGNLRPETEKEIRKRIGSFEDFALTSLSSQDRTWDIIKCKETERKKILYKFLDLDIFEQKYLLAKEDSRQYFDKLKEFDDYDLDLYKSVCEDNISEIRKDMASFSKDIKKDKLDIEQNNKNILDLLSQKENTKIKSNEIDIKNSIKKNDDEISYIKKESLTIKEKIDFVIDRIKKIKSEKESININEIRSLLKRYSDLNDIRLSYESSKNSIEENIKRINKKISLLDEVPCGDKFPNCKFLIDAFSSKGILSDLQIEYNNIEEKIATTKNNIDKLNFKNLLSDNKKYDDLSFESDKLSSELNNLKLQLENKKLKLQNLNNLKKSLQADLLEFSKHEIKIAKNIELDNKISELKNRINLIQKNSDNCNKKLLDANRKLGAELAKLKSIKDNLAELNSIKTLCESYEYYMKMMGKYGIAHNILTEKLPLINNEISKVLSKVVDFNVFLEHDEEEQSIRLYIQYGDFKSRLIELCSGAEKMFASIAIRAALLNISNLPKSNIFIIDEGFGKLDISNTENVYMMLDYLSTIFDYVIIISHMENMKDMVDDVIDIMNDDEGYPNIKIC